MNLTFSAYERDETLIIEIGIIGVIDGAPVHRRQSDENGGQKGVHRHAILQLKTWPCSPRSFVLTIRQP